MLYDDDYIQTISGKSLEEIKDKLFRLYGTDYQAVEKFPDVESYGPFKMFKRPVIRVKYVVHRDVLRGNSSNKREAEAEQLEDNRNQIITQQNLLIATQLNSKIEELKDEFSKQISKIPQGGKHTTIKRIEEILQENEFSFSYIEMITDKIKSYFSIDQLDDYDLVQTRVLEWIGETIQVNKEKVFRPPHVIIIVGPTGIGKTSTLIKLIGRAIIEAKEKNRPRPKYCVITIDNIRAGSYEQIKKMIEAIDQETPVKQANSSDDVKEIYEEYKNHVDYIFIDSAGCSPNDAEHIGLMKNILDVRMNADIYLGITASTKASDLANIFKNYEPFGYESVIVTKNDESIQLGNVISVMYEKHKSISYITNGQFVKNIRKADVVDILMNLSGFDIDKQRLENKFGKKD